MVARRPIELDLCRGDTLTSHRLGCSTPNSDMPPERGERGGRGERGERRERGGRGERGERGERGGGGERKGRERGG